MRLVVVESPYSSGTPVSIPAVVERNVRYLRACMRDSVLRGESPYASHGLLTQEGVLCDEIPDERKLGIEAGFAWRPAALISVFYTDLGWSTGMTHGFADAKALRDRNCSHCVQERQLGGFWAACDGCVGLGERAAAAGPLHAYRCPMWRVRVAG